MSLHGVWLGEAPSLVDEVARELLLLWGQCEEDGEEVELRQAPLVPLVGVQHQSSIQAESQGVAWEQLVVDELWCLLEQFPLLPPLEVQ